MSNAHNKPIVSKGIIRTSNNAPYLNKSDFDQAIDDHGYKIWVEKALKCPCANHETGQPLPNCSNCQGMGWFFIDRKETRCLIQNINQNTKYQRWTEEDRGTISISASYEDRMAFMDRIILPEVEAVFTENLYFYLDVLDNKYRSFSTYSIEELEYAFLWQSPSQKHIQLEQGTNLDVDGFKLEINPDFVAGRNYIQVSIRYKHKPTYNIIDENRSIVKSRNPSECHEDSKGVKLVNLPMNYMARKTHFMFELPNSGGESVFDNTTKEPLE